MRRQDKLLTTKAVGSNRQMTTSSHGAKQVNWTEAASKCVEILLNRNASEERHQTAIAGIMEMARRLDNLAQLQAEAIRALEQQQ